MYLRTRAQTQLLEGSIANTSAGDAGFQSRVEQVMGILATNAKHDLLNLRQDGESGDIYENMCELLVLNIVSLIPFINYVLIQEHTSSAPFSTKRSAAFKGYCKSNLSLTNILTLLNHNCTGFLLNNQNKLQDRHFKFEELHLPIEIVNAGLLNKILKAIYGLLEIQFYEIRAAETSDDNDEMVVKVIVAEDKMDINPSTIVGQPLSFFSKERYSNPRDDGADETDKAGPLVNSSLAHSMNYARFLGKIVYIQIFQSLLFISSSNINYSCTQGTI